MIQCIFRGSSSALNLKVTSLSLIGSFSSKRFHSFCNNKQHTRVSKSHIYFVCFDRTMANFIHRLPSLQHVTSFCGLRLESWGTILVYKHENNHWSNIVMSAWWRFLNVDRGLNAIFALLFASGSIFLGKQKCTIWHFMIFFEPVFLCLGFLYFLIRLCTE